MELRTTHKKRGVTPRAVLLALALVPANNYWIYMSESIRYTGHPTCMSLFYNAITVLLLLAGLNALIRRVAPGAMFSQGEMITVYVMIAIASVPASHDMLQILIPGMVYPQLFGRSGDGWSQAFTERLPAWLAVRDSGAIRAYAEGGRSLYEADILLAWLLPAAVWVLFLVTLVFVMLCLTVLVRRQWTENEKLSYPLVQLPLEMTSERRPVFQSHWLWAGASMAAAMGLLQGLRVLYPSVPDLGLKTHDLTSVLTSRPWAAAGWWPVHLYLFAVGLGAIVPVDLSFSMWFFFLVTKLQMVGSAWLGYDQSPRAPYLPEQAFGAILGVFVVGFWNARRYWVSMLRRPCARSAVDASTRNPVRHRSAALGAMVGTVALFVFARSLGMSIWLIPVFFIVFFAMCVAQTRMRAELGPPVHDFFLVGPDTMLPAIFGSAGFGTDNLVALTSMYWFNRSYRSLAMPIQLEALKMSDQVGISQRRLLVAMLLAVAVGAVAAFWSELHVACRLGAYAQGVCPRGFGAEPFNRLSAWSNNPTGSNGPAALAALAGLVLTFALNAARMRLQWFPLHPVGYALSGNWSMNLLWFSLLIAWLAKLLLLRFGGLRAYRAAIPFFLGLILGEFAVGSFWSLYGVITGLRSYSVFP